MAELDIANDALILIGEDIITALSDRPNDLELIISRERKKVLSLFKPSFARKRIRVTAAGILDASAKIITFADADPDTIADNGNGLVDAGFEAGDIITVSESGVNTGDYGIASILSNGSKLTLESHESLTAEVLTNDSNLKLYARPAHRWAWKYPKPSGSIAILGVNEFSPQNQGSWATEGDYIVTDQIDTNDQINITYIQDITDYDVMSDLFKELWSIKLAAVLAVTIKENTDEAKFWNKHFDWKLKQSFREDAYESHDDLAVDSREDTGWQSAGRYRNYDQYYNRRW